MKNKDIQLSDHFDVKRMIRFTMPSIIMMIFTSIYGVVDGFFVSNFVGKTPFAAVNFIFPVIMLLGALGFMFGTGGSALVAMTLGTGRKEKANKLFTMTVYISFFVGVLLAIISFFLIEPVASVLGAEGQFLADSVLYGKIIICALPFFMLQFEFQSFFITAEKPKLGLYFTVASGVTNMILDYLFMAVFDWGLVGAALATSLSQVVGGVIPIVYFARKNNSLLCFTKFEFDGRALIKTCTNGSSELMNNISMSLVSMLYNFQLMKYAGEDGIAAYGVLMYVNMIFLAIFIGFSVGISPVIGYHHGACNHSELHGLLKKSIIIIGVSSMGMLLLGELLALPLSVAFVGYDKGLMDITLHGFIIYSFSFLFSGIAIFGSSFFTALNDGLISAVMAFIRTIVFQVIAVIVLPLFLNLSGIWLSIVVAEFGAAVISVLFIFVKRHKYNY